VALPFIIASSALVAAGGTSLLTYRRALADELGMLHVMLVGAASVGDTTRIVLADELRDDEAGHDFLGSPWVYVATGAQAGAQRRVLDQPETGYQGPAGALVVSRPFTAALAAGTTVEITSPLPVKRHLGIKGLNDCVNEALMRCPALATLTLELTGDDTSDRLALDDYPWLTHADQILEIDNLYGVTGAASSYPTGLPYSIVANGASRELVLGRQYSSGETIEIQVLLSGDRLVYDGSAWGYPDVPGLQGDDDQAAIPEHWVTTFGMSRALRFLYRLTSQDRTLDPNERRARLADLMVERQKWANACMVLRDREFPRARVVSGRPLVSGTSMGYGDGYPVESGARTGWSW
jgi:hypothetical protein